MRKINAISNLLIVLFISIPIIHSCKANNNKEDILRKVLINLEQIKSAAYSSALTMNPPGDTITFNTYHHFKKEFVNPADTFIGSAFIWLNAVDTSKMYLSYDGNASIHVNDDSKTVSIDSFKTVTNLIFRPVSEPFFHRAGSIINYALNTTDSIITELTDFGDSIRYSLFIPDKIIFFFGIPFISDSPYLLPEQKYSRYEIWIHTSDYLPYKIGLKLSYTTDFEIVSNVEINKYRLEDFSAEMYFPPDYTIKERGKNQVVTKDLTGKTAPEWTLKDSENNSLSLRDFKSKVLMIEFTGIGCAPCHSAIPFLKQLADEYKNKDFELISIETWSMNVDASKRYKEFNKLNFIFLAATNDVKKSYNAEAVPAFYFLDRARVIRKMIRGYEKGTTDKEIRGTIDMLLK